MEAAAYAEMRALEDHHWWFRGRRRRSLPLVAEALAGRERPRVLEVGCGTGGNLAALERAQPDARLVGLDFDPGAVAFCGERSLRASLVRGDGLRLPFADGAFDAVLAFDIVEHFEDDAALLAELHRVLAPGGALVATVPQYPLLWSPHDEFLHHRRRYRGGELEAKLAGAGFRVRRRLGFNFLLLPPIAAVRALKAARSRGPATGTDFFRLPAPLNAALTGLFSVEAAIARVLPLSQGVSLMVRAERPADGSPSR